MSDDSVQVFQSDTHPRKVLLIVDPGSIAKRSHTSGGLCMHESGGVEHKVICGVIEAIDMNAGAHIAANVKTGCHDAIEYRGVVPWRSDRC